MGIGSGRALPHPVEIVGPKQPARGRETACGNLDGQRLQDAVTVGMHADCPAHGAGGGGKRAVQIVELVVNGVVGRQPLCGDVEPRSGDIVLALPVAFALDATAGNANIVD